MTLNETFRKRPECLLNDFSTFILRPVSRGCDYSLANHLNPSVNSLKS